MSLHYQEAIEHALGTAAGTPAATAAARPRRRIALAGRIGLVWLPAYVFAAADRPALVALAAATVITAVWYGGMKAAYVGFRLRRPALGNIGTAAVASLTGAIAASAAGLWVPVLIRPGIVLELVGAVFLLSIGWEAIALRLAPARRRVVVVGAADGGEELIEELALGDDTRYDVVGIIDDGRSGRVAGVPVLGGIDHLPTVVGEHLPDLVVLAIARDRLRAFESLLDAGSTSFEVVGLPEFHEQAFGRVPVRHLNAAWFMSCLHFYRRPYSRFAKRAFDIVVATIGLLATAPVFPVIALLVRRTAGPVIFRQTRLGEGGRLFTIYKFRTMHADAEDGTPRWAGERDPRTIPGGRLLRLTRLDELPQLWNVLKGEMSIVGPRPERPEFLEVLREAVPFWTNRHLVKPGITGWAQVRRGYTASADETIDKLAYDLWYLRHRSLVTDLAICARTFSTLVSGVGAR